MNTQKLTPPERKRTQHQRIVKGMIEVAGSVGYAEASIAAVIAHAKVSRPTFYDYFADKDECFLAALSAAEADVLGMVERALAREAPERALQAAIRALVEFADAQPTAARLLMCEPMVAGVVALDVRDRRITRMAQLVDDAYAQIPPSAAIPDFPSRLLIGGVDRVIGLRVLHGSGTADLLSDLLEWLAYYELPTSESRWRSFAPAPPPPPSPFLAQGPLGPPPPLPRGRSAMSKEEVAENHRLRLIFAAARVAMEKGSSAASILDIANAAGLDRRAFRHLFNDKHEVFAAAHELSFQRVVAATASAFFAGETWPERVWESGRAFVQSIEQNPGLAHVSFIEFYAAGPSGVQRNNERLLAFALFLQEGHQHTRAGAPPPHLAFEAIAASNFELVYTLVRRVSTSELSCFIPHATFLDLAPFLGTVEANRFIDAKLREHASRAGEADQRIL